MPTVDELMEERIRELAGRVAHASRMSFGAARVAIESCLRQFNIPTSPDIHIQKQLEEIYKHIPKRKRGNWYCIRPERRSLVKTRGPRMLVVLDKPDSRRYRRIRTKQQKRKRAW